MTHILVYSLVICGIGAALEGAFAGGSVRQRLSTLRMPIFSVPFWAWVVIGVFYYAICFAILYRLFLLNPGTARTAGFALLGTLMFINALWNYFFFRSPNLFHAYLLGLPYNAVAIALLTLLARIDRVAALCLLPYILYLFYANIWGYRVWKLNQ